MSLYNVFAASKTESNSHSQRRLMRLQQIESMEDAAMGLTKRISRVDSFRSDPGIVESSATTSKPEQPTKKCAILDASLRMLWRERVEQLKRGDSDPSLQMKKKGSSSRAA